MTILRYWLLVCTLLASFGSQAELRLQLETDRLSPLQRQASETLLNEALSLLPAPFKQRLDQQVKVRWRYLPTQVYGRAGRFSGIELNRALLPALSDGSSASMLTKRPHGTVRRELLATVAHELTHLYDQAQLWPEHAKRQQWHCRQRRESSGVVGLPDSCRGQVTRRFTLSDDPILLDLAGWPQQVGKRGMREQDNHQVARSPDSYELSNPQEFLAVNMEYFLLDPSYACRRPSLARYLSAHFDWTPKAQSPCAEQIAYLNAGRDFARQPLGNIDPRRVYQVDYLLAEANDAWVSRWGHSMLRLVICAPGRPLGPDCRLDLQEHLVLSYRAFVGDVQLSNWDGLTGAYPSRLFVLPLAQVIEEYTKIELRGLASVPLKLDRQQVEQLVTRALEQHWSYDGDYWFLSNNCAVETLKLMRSGSQHPGLQALDSIMPNGLLDTLVARDLADRTVLDDSREALRLGYRFDSFRDRYQAMFSVLQEQLPIEQTQVEDWLSLPAESRRPWFAQADVRAGAALLLLEQAAFRRQLLLAQDELKRRYLSGRDGVDPSLNKAGSALQQILANSGFLSRPAELLDGGYGLPQQAEWQRLETESQARQQQLRQLSDNLDQEVRNLLEPARMAELKASEANLTEIGKHLRALNKASGGLVLP